MSMVALLFASLISSGTAAHSHPKKRTSTSRLAHSMVYLFSDAVLASSVTTLIRNVCVRLCIAIPPMIFSSTWQISPSPGSWLVHSRFGYHLFFFSSIQLSGVVGDMSNAFHVIQVLNCITFPFLPLFVLDYCATHLTRLIQNDEPKLFTTMSSLLMSRIWCNG